MLNRLTELRDKRDEDGFTLIELLVVVVIIGILIAIAIPLYLNYKKGANDKAAQSDLRSAISALEQCMADNGNYPTAFAVASNNVTFTGCTESVKLSGGTTLNYYPDNTTTATKYIVSASNSGGNVTGGSKGAYCYASAAGGSVKKTSGAEETAYPTATDACP